MRARRTPARQLLRSETMNTHTSIAIVHLRPTHRRERRQCRCSDKRRSGSRAAVAAMLERGNKEEEEEYDKWD
uniref:Uncharacterized protein n=1 Tax=Oryza punctata TaxID=4537 RepID=A0A0E0MCV7_ORYPU